MIDVMIVVRNAHGHTNRVYEQVIQVPYGSMQPVHVQARKMVADAERSWNVKCTYNYVILD